MRITFCFTRIYSLASTFRGSTHISSARWHGHSLRSEVFTMSVSFYKWNVNRNVSSYINLYNLTVRSIYDCKQSQNIFNSVFHLISVRNWSIDPSFLCDKVLVKIENVLHIAIETMCEKNRYYIGSFERNLNERKRK